MSSQYGKLTCGLSYLSPSGQPSTPLQTQELLPSCPNDPSLACFGTLNNPLAQGNVPGITAHSALCVQQVCPSNSLFDAATRSCVPQATPVTPLAPAAAPLAPAPAPAPSCPANYYWNGQRCIPL